MENNNKEEIDLRKIHTESCIATYRWAENLSDDDYKELCDRFDMSDWVNICKYQHIE